MKELKASEPLLLDGVLTPDAILKDPTLSVIRPKRCWRFPSA